jgi:TPR repeat protein
VCYENGHGTPQDLDHALRLYSRAADKGQPEASAGVKRLAARLAATPGRPA